MRPEQRKEIENIFKDFIKTRYASIRKLSLNDLQINTLFLRQLAKHMNWTSAKDVVRFIVDESFQRGVVTSAGFKIEKIAKVFCKPTAVKGIDLEIDKPRPGGGTDTYYIQIKSGPNTIHGDTQEAIERNFKYALKRNPRAIPLVGISYGNVRQANSFTKELMKSFNVLFGKDFWAFLSDNPACLEEIYTISMHIASTFVPTFRRTPYGKSLNRLIEDKIDEITREWESTYGKLSPKMWKKML